MNAYALPKPRVTPRGPDNFDVDFGCGHPSVRIFRHSTNRPDRDWWYETEDQPARLTWGEQGALAAAWMESIDAPPPIGLSREEAAQQIAAAECDATSCTKLMRQWLKLRTGITWSVTRGRGTGASWLRIHSPLARRVTTEGKPATENWGYMAPADRALLGVVLGELPHNQGESIRTERGVRAWYLWKISGYGVPEDLNVAPPSWD